MFQRVINLKALKSCSGYFLRSTVTNLLLLLLSFWYLTGKAEEYQEALKQKQVPGYGALGVMEQHLANHAFFTRKNWFKAPSLIGRN